MRAWWCVRVRRTIGQGVSGFAWLWQEKCQRMLVRGAWAGGGVQIFEQVFEAYEQRLPKRLRAQYRERGWVDPREVPAASCPAERHLQLTFNQTPQVSTTRPAPSFRPLRQRYLAVRLPVGRLV